MTFEELLHCFWLSGSLNEAISRDEWDLYYECDSEQQKQLNEAYERGYQGESF